MNRQQKRELDRLDEKIEKARVSNNFVKLIQLQAERNRMVNSNKRHITLKDALENYTPEERREATTEIIYAVATADILYGITMDVEERLKKRFDIDGVPMMSELRTIVKKLSAVVKTIDEVGIMPFSSNYGDVVDKVETKYAATMKNFIRNEIMKASKV